MRGPVWRKSHRSPEGTSGDCVEVADLASEVIGVRDSKAPEAGHLALPPAAFAVLVDRIKDGALDL